MTIAFTHSRRNAIRVGGLALTVIALLCVAIFVARGRAQAKAPTTYPQEISRVTFAVAGDVIPHEPVVEAAKAVATPDNHDGWDALFANVSDVFRDADYGFVNLETPVAPVHSIGSKAFQFNAPVALVDSLKFNGVKIVSFANNHVMDQGWPGFDETLGHLRDEGMLFVGSGATADAAWQPVILEKNGIRIGWIGMTRWLNGRRNPDKDSEPHVAFFPYPGESNGAPGRDEASVIEAIKAARAQCDLLLVSIHWGIEYSPTPRPEDVEAAHAFLEAGASAVIAHHPHVLQPIETYVTQDQRKTVIFYSLGNFLSNQSASYVQDLMPDKTAEPRESIMARFAVVKKDYGPAGTRVELSDVGIMPIWEENNRLDLRSGRAKAPSIYPVFMDRVIPQLQARVDQLSQIGAQMTDDQKREFTQVSNELAMMKHQREMVLDRTGDDYVVAPPALPAGVPSAASVPPPPAPATNTPSH
ncbi:MAG TPA: CapA family protein [Candidatus Baltobacteraceae bacterium]|nr:CapA family protein [Candidatus Baltobacteraceae bacterium]